MGDYYVKSEYRRMKKLTKRDKTGDDNRSAIKVKCKYCGCVNTIPAFQDNKICNWCHHKIINNTKAHFMRKMKELMKEGE